MILVVGSKVLLNPNHPLYGTPVSDRVWTVEEIGLDNSSLILSFDNREQVFALTSWVKSVKEIGK